MFDGSDGVIHNTDKRWHRRLTLLLLKIVKIPPRFLNLFAPIVPFIVALFMA